MNRHYLWLASVMVAVQLAGPVSADSAADAEESVRELYYEGFPAELATGLDDAAIERLAELLDDPAEASHHGNIVLALGLSGHPDAYPALSVFAAAPLRGEVDRATFRARTQLRTAFGQLARVDPRALRWLLEDHEADAPTTWHFRHHRDEALRVLLDELALTGLALSGAPAAATRLDRVIGESRGLDRASQRRRQHAEAVRARHDRASAPGLDR